MRILPFIILASFFLIISPAYAQEITSFVNDDSNILGDEKQQIEQVAQQLYGADLAQIAIVIINSLDGQSIEDVAFTLAEGKLGTQDKDNGLLLLIAVQERTYRFEVGRGLEPIFNDAKIGRYGRELLVPAFQQEKYGVGVLLVMNEINNELTGQESENLPDGIDEKSLENTPKPAQIIMFLLFVVLFFSILLLMIKKTARKKRLLPWKRRSHDDRYFWAALIASRMMRGGGRFGGGFGGFGGGNFGGGGASGRW